MAHRAGAQMYVVNSKTGNFERLPDEYVMQVTEDWDVEQETPQEEAVSRKNPLRKRKVG